MATIDEALAIALQRHQSGDPGEAARIYRLILNADARHVDALHLLGLTERAAGRPAEAAALIRRALEIRPDLIQAQHNLGNLLSAQGDLDGAARAYRAALILQPEFFESAAALGNLLTRLGGPDHWPKAVVVSGWAIRLRPAAAEPYADLGLALRQSEKLTEAVTAYRAGIARRCDFAPAHMSLGNALLEAGDLAGAARTLRRGLALMPAGRELYYNLGNALHAAGDLTAAAAAYERSARLTLSNGMVRAALVYEQQGDPGRAVSVAAGALAHSGVEVSTCFEIILRAALAEGGADKARDYFAGFVHNPLPNGKMHAGEALTALAALDLRQGRPNDAAARLVNVSGDDCRFFTIRSLARLQGALAESGGRLARPEPASDGRPRVGSSTLATHGRFAHNALEYILLRLYAEKYGMTLETPDWVGGWYFDVDDPRQGPGLSPWLFSRRILNAHVQGDYDRIADAPPPRRDCDILSPLFLFDHKAAFREKAQAWLKPRACWSPFIEPAVAALRARGRTVVAVHIRRGDFVQYNYPITETAWYVDWLTALWPTLDAPVLYLASDDLQGVKRDFAAFDPVTLTDVAEPWPQLEYLQDFHVLANADVVGTSAASGFSLLAARLNTRARLFVEPDVKAGRVKPFSPWV